MNFMWNMFNYNKVPILVYFRSTTFQILNYSTPGLGHPSACKSSNLAGKPHFSCLLVVHFVLVFIYL